MPLGTPTGFFCQMVNTPLECTPFQTRRYRRVNLGVVASGVCEDFFFSCQARVSAIVFSVETGKKGDVEVAWYKARIFLEFFLAHRIANAQDY